MFVSIYISFILIEKLSQLFLVLYVLSDIMLVLNISHQLRYIIYYLSSSISLLTHNTQMHNGACLGLRRDLTLVGALVLELHILDLQGPSFRVRRENRLKALIRNECRLIHGQNVSITHTKPRNRFFYQLLYLSINQFIGGI